VTIEGEAMQMKLAATMLAGMIAVTAAAAHAQAPKPAANGKAAAPVNTMCGECGVVRSVRAIVKEAPPPPSDASKPSGLVASVPFGPGAGKMQVGGSQNIGKDAVAATTTWEVVVRLDDGRFRVLMLEEEPAELREGDKVRIDQGRPLRRQ
jgi:hypothetical protein